MPEPEISVVVTVRNGAAQLPGLLDALSRQTLPRSRFELVVVDDGSSDRTSAVAEASGIARVIRSQRHVGLPRARNIGVGAAVGDIFALTDGDTVPDSTWLELGVARMTETGADILGGSVSIALGERPSIAALVDAMSWLNPEACVANGYALGANMWTRRSAFERWGLFDEELASYGHEETEWGKRATQDGARLVYAPDVHVTHPSRPQMKRVVKKAYALGFGLAPLRRAPRNTYAGQRRLFLIPSWFLPPRRIALERLRARGYEPGAVDVVLIYLSQWLFVRLPTLAGDLVGEACWLVSGRSSKQELPDSA